jgi:cytoskeletal protein CcmA (bactofilin family)
MAMINKKSDAPEGGYPETVVSAGMRIEGELKSSGNISIDGIIAGKVNTAQDLEVGPHAQIDGDLTAQNVAVAGTVKGNVTAKDGVQILATGKITGNISCRSVSIQDGAYFNGNCRMQEPKPEIKAEE